MIKRLVFLLMLLFPLSVYGFSDMAADCTKCHTISKEEANQLLKEIIPNATILEIKDSPFKGFWEVDIETGGKKGLLYVDFSKKFLFAGSIVDIKAKRNLSQERFTELNKIDVASIPLDDALILGNKEAKHRIIVFDDPDCPFCAKLHQEMKKVVEERKDIAFYLKMYPLKIHPKAYEKAKTIVCEKSIALLEDSFAKKEIPKPNCETKVIDENIKLAERLGISGTPAMIFPDGRLVPGAMDAKKIIEMIGK